MKRQFGILLTVTGLAVLALPAIAFEWNAYRPTTLQAIDRESKSNKSPDTTMVIASKVAFDANFVSKPIAATQDEADVLRGALIICGVEDYPPAGYTVWVQSGAIKKKLYVQDTLVDDLLAEPVGRKPVPIRVFAAWLTSTWFDGRYTDDIVMNGYMNK